MYPSKGPGICAIADLVAIQVSIIDPSSIHKIKNNFSSKVCNVNHTELITKKEKFYEFALKYSTKTIT